MYKNNQYSTWARTHVYGAMSNEHAVLVADAAAATSSAAAMRLMRLKFSQHYY